MFPSKGIVSSGVQQYSSTQRSIVANPSIPRDVAQHQQNKIQAVVSVQEPAKEEGAQFQWTSGQGIDFSDAYQKGR
jgi:hypothetical protein